MLNLASLNPQQREAVETLRGPVLILAGAGTGKTRVITFRMAHMVERGIAPAHILGVTFTNKAAREMRERVAKLAPRARREDRADETITIGTFHSLCVRILRQHIHRLGYKHNFVIYDEADQLGVVKRILGGISSKGTKVDPGAVLAWLSRDRNGGTKSGAALDADARALAGHLRAKYESALRACNAVDFDDLILLTLKLFSDHPEALTSCRERFRYIMVDEFQDTNDAQFRLVHSLAGEHRNLCVVGDDDQSIYGWRGAEIANLLDMEKHYPEVKIVKLEQNYRSTNVILGAANAVIKNNARRREKNLWSQKGQGDRIQLQAFESDDAEATAVVEQIEFLRLAGRIPWSEQAILFRTNQQSRPIETALRKAGVPYHLIGGPSFFDRREVKDFLAYLKTIQNPEDDTSLLRIANVPARGLSDATMERLLGASHERSCSVYEIMRHTDILAQFPSRTRESLLAFADFIDSRRRSLEAAPSGSLRGWTEDFIAATGYLGELRRVEKNPEEAENRVRNVQELAASMDQAGEAGLAPMTCLEKFLESVALDNEFPREKKLKGEAVTLITMHSCKGLEFPHVFVVGVEDGLLPHSRSKSEGTIDEERRLFYVSMTRAMLSLHISHCGGRRRYGQLTPCHPSPFLGELPPELVENVDPSTRKPVTVQTGKNLFAALRHSLG